MTVHNEPEKTTVDGYTLRTLSDPRRGDINYGRAGALIVFGQNRQLVAESLKGWDKKEGIFGDKKVADTLKKQEAIGVGTWSLGESSVLLCLATSRPSILGPERRVDSRASAWPLTALG